MIEALEFFVCLTLPTRFAGVGFRREISSSASSSTSIAFLCFLESLVGLISLSAAS